MLGLGLGLDLVSGWLVGIHPHTHTHWLLFVITVTQPNAQPCKIFLQQSRWRLLKSDQCERTDFWKCCDYTFSRFYKQPIEECMYWFKAQKYALSVPAGPRCLQGDTFVLVSPANTRFAFYCFLVSPFEAYNSIFTRPSLWYCMRE